MGKIDKCIELKMEIPPVQTHVGWRFHFLEKLINAVSLKSAEDCQSLKSTKEKPGTDIVAEYPWG